MALNFLLRILMYNIQIKKYSLFEVCLMNIKKIDHSQKITYYSLLVLGPIVNNLTVLTLYSHSLDL